MKCFVSPAGIEVVNQTECRLVEDITYQFPGSGEPFGPNNLFLDATQEDIDRATAIGKSTAMLSGLVAQVRRQRDIMGPGGYRKSDTLDAFETCTVGDANFNLLRDATLLVAVQDIPSPTPNDETHLSEWDCNMLAHCIEGARLLGAVMTDAELITPSMDALATRFLDLYTNTDYAFRNSASSGARTLLQGVRTEYVYAVYGGPIENRLRYNPDLNPDAAILSYQVQNPFIVRLANQQPETPNALIS